MSAHAACYPKSVKTKPYHFCPWMRSENCYKSKMFLTMNKSFDVVYIRIQKPISLNKCLIQQLKKCFLASHRVKNERKTVKNIKKFGVESSF